MTLVQLRQDPLVTLIAKAAKVDQASAKMALQLACYDALMEGIETNREDITKALGAGAVERTLTARRGLVRAFISKRMEGEDIGELLAGSLAVAAVGSTLVAKAWQDEKRGQPGNRGQWAKTTADLGRAFVNPETKEQERGKRTADKLPFKDDGSLDGYKALNAFGSVLRAAPVPGTTAVGLAAQLASGAGPEAQKVLGPHLKRAAYRYRGTDIRPPKDLVARLGEINKNPSASESAKIGARGNWAVAGLDPQVPTPDDYMISVQSGEVPPSRGVIIDSRGRLAASAVGYQGDHYLPFNLRNLSGLQGGQYVRTRAAGGPTQEDLYTAVVGGARQIQVVSNSGVFTVKFDDDMRGGRRYSDKASRMVSRYGQILDAIQDDKIETGQLPKETTDAIRADVLSQYKNADANTLSREYDKALKREKQRRSFDRGDGDDTMAAALKQTSDQLFERSLRDHPDAGTTAQVDMRREADRTARLKFRNENYRTLRLDGDGYERALKALKQEFPQFITSATREDRDDFLGARNLPKPPQARPSGLFHGDKGSLTSGVSASSSRLQRKGAKNKSSEPDTAGAEDKTKPGGETRNTGEKRLSFDNLTAEVPRAAQAEARTALAGVIAGASSAVRPTEDMTLAGAQSFSDAEDNVFATLQVLQRDNGGTPDKLFNKAMEGGLKTEESEALVTALRNVPESGQYKDLDYKRIKTQATAALDLLSLGKPFGGPPSANPLTDLRAVADGGLPPAYPDILQAGPSTKLLDREINRSREVDAEASKMSGQLNGRPYIQARADDLLDEHKEAVDDEDEAKQADVAQAAANFLRGASFHAAFDTANRLTKLKGGEPSPFPQAPATPEPPPAAAEEEDDWMGTILTPAHFQKRDRLRSRVVFLDPVSPVAKAMRAQLLRKTSTQSS